MSTAQYGSLKFTQAIDFFKNKVDVPTQRWNDIWRDQHNLAFMVAGATKEDLLSDLRQMVDDAIANGKSLNWFQKEFKGLVKKHGWDHTGSAAWRANVIYSTNMRQSYNAGRHAQLQHFDYWRYAHGDSRNPRLHHKVHHGKILPKSSPWWNVWFPQNGWGCKCKVFGESARSIERKGLKISEEPVITTREWTDKKTGEVHHVPEGIDPGFDYSPGKVDPATRLKEQRAKLPPMAERVSTRHVPSAFSTVPSVSIDGFERITGELLTSPAADQVKQFVNFIQKFSLKTVVVSAGEMARGKKAMAIAEDVASYLGLERFEAVTRYTVSREQKPEGFTSQVFEHVTIKANSKQCLSKVDVQAMIKGVNAIAKDGYQETGKHQFKDRKRWYASSEATGDFYDHASRYLTWLHEMGHQVHYKAGIPNLPDIPKSYFLTEYGHQKKEREWFAEHFVFWLLDREQMQQNWPNVARWYDDLMRLLVE